MNGLHVWADSFYDEVIRNSAHLERCRKYIRENPMNWLSDPDYVELV